jgi:hypothetical protein
MTGALVARAADHVARVIEVAMGHEDQIERLERLRLRPRGRAVGIAEPRVEHDALAAWKPEVKRRVSQPGDG